jgi:flagellar protein FliO/FliZ
MDADVLLRFALARAVVLGLIGLCALAARRFGLGGAPRRHQGRRLAIVESAPIDARRRLVLVRRDDVEHLVLLGGGSESVIETAIPVRQEAGRPADAAAPRAGGIVTAFARHLAARGGSARP